MAAQTPTPRRGMPPLLTLALALGLGALVVLLVRRAAASRGAAADESGTAGPEVPEADAPATDGSAPGVAEPHAATG